MKKCPNCGACQECGHVPDGSWVQPIYPSTAPTAPYSPPWVMYPNTCGGVAHTAPHTMTYTIWNTTGGSYPA